MLEYSTNIHFEPDILIYEALSYENTFEGVSLDIDGFRNMLYSAIKPYMTKGKLETRLIERAHIYSKNWLFKFIM